MIQHIKKIEQDTSENDRENLIIEDKSLSNPKDYHCQTQGQPDAGNISKLYEKDPPKKEEREKSLNTEVVCSKSGGRKYITIRNIPLGADPKKLRTAFSKSFPVVSMGVVKVNNMGSILLHLQPRKDDNVELLYRVMKANEDLLN
ncbi:unnamed protein product [Debaryomyces tyrocola]|nr:unnamed protein product [Debaryomyces tyrocola]